MANDNDIVMVRGDNGNITAIIHDVDLGNINIAGASIAFTVRSIQDQKQIFQKTTGGGTVIITDAANGTCVAFILPADTATIAPGRYVYDFEVTLATKVFSYVGKIRFLQDVTHA